ncbi:hypothetical protein M426DRAFT_10294 [Hypoxylon sp. CI-4A]|nr:hypothetical protein M426DRAFT_10294 [Hypoxylon sp. CI-4A]
MAERPPPHARAGTNRTTRTNTAGIRRNLFQNQLTRRPTPTTSSSNNSVETLRLGEVEVLSDTSDIVIRDRNGEFEIGDPPSPTPDDPEETGGALDEVQENERERQKLAEALKHHQISHSRAQAQPEEVLETLRASMKAKVAALTEDNWMYEPEEQIRPL